MQNLKIKHQTQRKFTFQKKKTPAQKLKTLNKLSQHLLQNTNLEHRI